MRKVKSMQMFRKPIHRAIQGDRIGICVTQFDPDKLERGLICKDILVSFYLSLIILISLYF